MNGSPRFHFHCAAKDIQINISHLPLTRTLISLQQHEKKEQKKKKNYLPRDNDDSKLIERFSKAFLHEILNVYHCASHF